MRGTPIWRIPIDPDGASGEYRDHAVEARKSRMRNRDAFTQPRARLCLAFAQDIEKVFTVHVRMAFGYTLGKLDKSFVLRIHGEVSHQQFWREKFADHDHPSFCFSPIHAPKSRGLDLRAAPESPKQ